MARGRPLLRLVRVTVALFSVAVATAASAGAAPSLIYGFSDDQPKWTGTQTTSQEQKIGARAARVTLRWTPGQTDLSSSDASELGTAVVSATGLRLVLAVYGSSAAAVPQDDTSRTQFCTYVKNAVVHFPSINDVVVWNEPNLSIFWRPQFNPDGTSAAPAAYEALLARCWDVLHAYRPTIDVLGPATSPHGNDNPNAGSNISHSPVNFIHKLGAAYRASGRTQPLFDTVAQHVYGNGNQERPFLMHTGTTIAEGDWNRLVQTLQTAFQGTGQRVPGQSCDLAACVNIWYLESGFQTTIPASKLGFYTGNEDVLTLPDVLGSEPEYPAPSPLATSPGPDQATQLKYAVNLAYCQPYVTAIFNYLLRDESSLAGWQSGVLWADGTTKASFMPLQTAVERVNSRTISCVAPTSPPRLTAEVTDSPPRVTLAWNGSASPIGVSGYTVYRDGIGIGQTTALTYTDTTAVAGSGYTYTVRAYDAAGQTGAASNSTSLVAAAGWPGFRFDAANSGFNPVETTLGVSTVGSLAVRWHDKLTSVNGSSLAVAGGRVYVAETVGTVRALDAAGGGTDWTTKLPGPSSIQVGSSAPTVAGGMVYIGTSRYTQLVALDASSGVLLWTTHLSDASTNVYSSATVANGKVYISADDGYLYALDARSGATLWKTLLRTQYSTPAVVGSVVYVTGSAGPTTAANQLYALNADTGALLWEGTGPLDLAASSPAVAAGRVYIGSNDGNVYAFAAAGCGAATCAPTWTSTLGASVSASPAVASGTVFIAAADRRLYALDAATGRQVWSGPTDTPLSASPAVANGVAYVGTRGGNVDAFAAAGCGNITCAPLWSIRLGDSSNGFYGSPAVASGSLYDLTSLGDVYALSAPPPPPPSPPPHPGAPMTTPPPPAAPPASLPVRPGKSPRCVVPNVRGRTIATSRQRLKRAHCALGRIGHSSSRVPRGRVISQRPATGAQLNAGGRVSLVVSRGRR